MGTLAYLLFDLDGTLYTEDTGLFAEVGKRIEHWLSRQLSVNLDQARDVRRDYYLRYGTTMAGLLQDRPDLDIDAYLDYVHDVDVAQYLDPDPRLDHMLSSLLVPKAIFTNSIADWAERIATHLGIRHHFQHIFDVRAVDYHCKPHPHAFNSVLNALNVQAQACVMLDDQPSYLTGATKVGMRTILVRPDGHRENGIDAVVPHILDAGPVVQRWLAAER